MSSIVKKSVVLFFLMLWIPAMIPAQENNKSDEGTIKDQGKMKMRGHGMMGSSMGGHEGEHSDGPRFRGPFSSSYSSYTTTNNTISSGTSDCLWGGRVCRETFGKNAERAIYIARTMDQISEDGARGTGPHFGALAQLMDCPPEQTGLFSREVKRNYPLIFAKSAPLTQEDISHVLEQFHGVIVRHETLNELCQSY